MGKVKVCTNLLRTEQIIASPVFDENGLLLAGEGTKVNDNNIYLLKSSGPEFVEIFEDSMFRWQKWMDRDERIKSISEKAEICSKDRYIQIIKNALIEFEKERKK